RRYDRDGRGDSSELSRAGLMRVSSDQWTISTLAGRGEPGFGGDGGPAIHALLNEPKSVALGPNRTVYIADSENHRIRRVDVATGLIMTVAGADHDAPKPSKRPAAGGETTDEDPFASEAEPASYVNVSDLSGTVRFVVGSAESRFGGDGGPAVEATLNFPSSVAVDTDGTL